MLKNLEEGNGEKSIQNSKFKIVRAAFRREEKTEKEVAFASPAGSRGRITND
ncbi:hypothetical protein LC607_15010 [Nostoc sp. CHAB 5824]|nr:hypothetical protein [Nostoc sp. CHAB 5824]